MKTVKQDDVFRVVGMKIRTANARAAAEIPQHWGKFMQESTAARIPQALSETVFAIYTDFENEGKNNDGEYTFIIGLEVPASVPVPPGLVEVIIPSAKYSVFPIEKGHPEKVFAGWQEIWKNVELQKTFVCDYERYDKDGTISIYVGVR